MNQPHPGFVGVDDYLKLPRDHSTWLLKPLIPISGAALLYGAEKTGKSYLAIQLALAITGQSPDWLGFPVVKKGQVLYLQLDTPRSLWAHRFEQMITKSGLKYDSNLLKLGDRETIVYHPFDILQPAHMKYLHDLVHDHEPVAVIIDTLRMSHSGDENDSTISRNVMANLVGATHPAALIVISHSRKPNLEGIKDTMADHRGSSNVTASVDAIMRLTKNRLYYAGRAIEEGDIKVERMENGLWQVKKDENADAALAKVVADAGLTSLNAKGRALSTLCGITESAAISRVRRWMEDHELPDTPVDKPEIPCYTDPSLPGAERLPGAVGDDML